MSNSPPSANDLSKAPLGSSLRATIWKRFPGSVGIPPDRPPESTHRDYFSIWLDGGGVEVLRHIRIVQGDNAPCTEGLIHVPLSVETRHHDPHAGQS